MSRYITLLKFTDAGANDAVDSVQRAESFRRNLNDRDGKVIDIFWTLGSYDGVCIFEAGSDEDAAAALLSLGARGFVHTNTMRAFDESDFLRVLAQSEL